MIEFSRSITNGSLARLTKLWLCDIQIGDAGIVEFSHAISIGSLPAFTPTCRFVRTAATPEIVRLSTKRWPIAMRDIIPAC